MQNFPIKLAIPHIVALVVFLIVSCAFFYPQLEGKRIVQTDIVSFKGMAQEIVEYREETGRVPLWTNSMFSGMPSYQITTGPGKNLILRLEQAVQLWIQRPIGYFIAAMIGFYVMFLVLGVNPWLSMVGAVAFALSTNNLILFEAGHTSKLRSLFMAAPMFAGMYLTFRKKYLIGGALFAAAFAANLFANHYQITYYLGLLFGIYWIFELVSAIKSQELPHIARATGILAIGVVLGVASSASKIMTTMEYVEDTMRGEPILEKNVASAASSSETDGLAWDYAMRWSNGVVDLLATVVPRAAGGSGSEETGEGSELFKNLRRMGARIDEPIPEPLYWGDLPFTSGPAYFGAVVVFLFILGLLLVKGNVKWWALTAVVLTMLMSMGENFETFNRLLFDYLPLYNKFRAPSSILTITALFIPLIGILGVSRILKGEVDATGIKKSLFIALGITGGICAIIALFGPSLFDFTSPGDAQYANAGYPVDAIIEDRKKFMRADAFRSLVLIVLGAVAIFAYQRGMLKKNAVIGAIALLVLIDLWGIGRRYLDEDNFVSEKRYDQIFEPDAADREILRDQDLYYRVHDVTADPWNSAATSYHHKTIGGYHAAKLQRYQDMIDYYLINGEKQILDMLNTKYLIVPGENNQRAVRRNPQAFGNAWFVEGILNVESADEEISVLKDLDLRAMAVVHKDFRHLVEGFDPSKNGTIKLVEYAPDRLVYESESLSDQLAVFSEVWYGPDKGWKAYIDGQPAELFRVNYILRGLNVPEGKHTIEMVFRPSTYYTGEILTLIFSSLIVLGLLGAIVVEWRRTNWEKYEPVVEKPKPKQPQKRKKKK